jgi:modification methylase
VIFYSETGGTSAKPALSASSGRAFDLAFSRRLIGIDINERHIKLAEERVRDAPGCEPLLLVGRAKYPTKEELKAILETEVGTAGKGAEEHKHKTYGRKVPIEEDEQLTLV